MFNYDIITKPKGVSLTDSIIALSVIRRPPFGFQISMTLNKPFEINVYIISKESLNVIEIKVSMSQSSFLCYAFQKEGRKLEAVSTC